MPQMLLTFLQDLKANGDTQLGVNREQMRALRAFGITSLRFHTTTGETLGSTRSPVKEQRSAGRTCLSSTRHKHTSTGEEIRPFHAETPQWSHLTSDLSGQESGG